MNYYENLLDVDFFSKDRHTIEYSNIKLTIGLNGPIWDSWQGNSSKDLVIQFYKKLKDQPDVLITNKILPDEETVIIMLLTEETYRSDDEVGFYYFVKKLYLIAEFKLKAIKLMYAWQAKEYLAGAGKGRIQKTVNSAINFIKSIDGEEIESSDIKIEIPVKKDFEKLNIHLNNQEELLRFYQGTNSYIKELTAANYQVETLFNYSLILEFLYHIGVKQIYDYGAGIGTFLALASKWGITGIYSDLKSKTMDYARLMLKQRQLSIPFVEIVPSNRNLPKEVECFVCTEVLEHIYEPEDLINHFYRSLKPNGILVVSESFDYVDEFCTHLPQHKGKGGDVFIKYMNKVGFKKLDLYFDIHPKVFIKQ